MNRSAGRATQDIENTTDNFGNCVPGHELKRPNEFSGQRDEEETMSRQTERHAARMELKTTERAAKDEARRNARRELLERQTAREKSGAYEGRSVGSAVAPSRSRITKRKVKKGKAFGRILSTEVTGGREVSYHATKGWRSHRA